MFKQTRYLQKIKNEIKKEKTSKKSQKLTKHGTDCARTYKIQTSTTKPHRQAQEYINGSVYRLRTGRRDLFLLRSNLNEPITSQTNYILLLNEPLTKVQIE